MTIPMEKRLSMAESKLSKDAQDLYNFIDTHNQEFGITRKTGLTLIPRNFFTSYNEESIRNHEGFRAYYFSMVDDEHRENLGLLFKAMSHDILIEVTQAGPHCNLEIFIPHCPFEKPKYFELEYNESLLEFIKSYIIGQINVRFTLEQLIIRMIDIETYGID